ncbi:deoxyguanosinetriphosphate triphosphohydrolase [Pseudactinotalea sp. Z1739]|uniref:deoxyguanosinetriphosphate triphosphohydrolase n=1 Tax=Pseudactinotalea sp. Z1739 TaxID=3413028 RepID=UPI003C7E2480
MFDLPVGRYRLYDHERWYAEAPKSAHRSDFERDRARIVHSSALRRLGAKTQVLGPGTDDFVRTRLTHTLEVAQVGRELAYNLGCDPDVVDAACLSHDLGHPPFGHNGENALHEVAADIGGFEGNAQTLRLLTRLEPKTFTREGRAVGLNLTRASLDASTKYPWFAGEGPADESGGPTRKFGAYADDAEVFAWMRGDSPPGRRCIEAQVMDLADDISYSVHDVEDAVVNGRHDLDQLRQEGMRERLIDQIHDWYGRATSADDLYAAIESLSAMPYWVETFDGTRRGLARLKDMTSQLIGRFAVASARATRATFGQGDLVRYDADVVVPDQVLAEITVLKGIAAMFVMAPREDEPLYGRQRQIVTDLVQECSSRPEATLETPFLADYREADDDAGRLRAVVDQVASLTDVSALEWHARLCQSNSGP